MAKFIDKLTAMMRQNQSLLCIGLDPDPELMPKVNIFDFNRAIIDATSDLVCAYKPNLAFYEALGLAGLEALQKTIEHIPDIIPVIGDAKRGDIGNTARMYAKALFDGFGFDAVTVNPYLGHDSLKPFIEYSDRGVLVLCRTSNAGALDFQSALCKVGDRVGTLFEMVADKAKEWNVHGNIGLVVGATYPEELKRVRQLCPDMLLLIPGIGAQGGDLASTVRFGIDSARERMVINSSRQTLYASRGKDFASAARQAANELRQQINSLL